MSETTAGASNPTSPVSVVVVSYNTREKLKKCLAAIEPEHEVIVVDNASRDGSAETVSTEFPQAILIRNSQNAGFGTANNQGSDFATRPLVLYLNSDAYAEPGAIARLAATFEDPSIVAAGGRLLNPDRTLQNSTANELTLWAVFCEQFYLEKLFPGSATFSPYWNTRKLIELPAPTPTPQVMGACLMTRRGLEAFNPRFFLYCEDTDLCRRLSSHGRIVFVKNATFVHELGSSSAADPVGAVKLYNTGKELFFLIHYGHSASATCAALDRLGALLRGCYWSLRWLAGGRSDASRLAKSFFALSFQGTR